LFYDSFGAYQGETNQGSNHTFGYAGMQLDREVGGAGQYYAMARYYDPDTGRFLSVDPLPSNNPYWYANNNPINLTDPTGMSPFSTNYNFDFGKYTFSAGAASASTGYGLLPLDDSLNGLGNVTTDFLLGPGTTMLPHTASAYPGLRQGSTLNLNAPPFSMPASSGIFPSTGPLSVLNYPPSSLTGAVSQSPPLQAITTPTYSGPSIEAVNYTKEQIDAGERLFDFYRAQDPKNDNNPEVAKVRNHIYNDLNGGELFSPYYRTPRQDAQSAAELLSAPIPGLNITVLAGSGVTDVINGETSKGAGKIIGAAGGVLGGALANRKGVRTIFTIATERQ